MDERLEKALEFRICPTNNQNEIRNRVAQLQIVHLGGVFIAT